MTEEWSRKTVVGGFGADLAQIVPDQMRGRVMSVYNLAFRLGIPLGSLGLGKVIPVIGISTALAGTGLALVVIAVFFVIVMRDVAIFRRSIRQAA